MGSTPNLMPFHASPISPKDSRCTAYRLGCLVLGRMGARTHCVCGSRQAVLGRTQRFGGLMIAVADFLRSSADVLHAAFKPWLPAPAAGGPQIAPPV